MGDIGRIPLLFRTRHHMPPIFALSDETSACKDGGRTHLNRGRQLSQVLIGSSSQLRLHIEQIRSLICTRVTLSPSCCCGICSDTLSVSRNVHWHVSNGDRTLNIGKVFDEHVRLAACRTHSPNFGSNATPSTTAHFQRLRTAACSHCFSCVAQDHQGTRIDNDSASSLYAFDKSFAVIAVCIRRLLV